MTLRWGGLTAEWTPEGIGLDDIGLDGRPVLDRVYVAVRTTTWGTIPLVVTGSRTEEHAAGFSARLTGRTDDPAYPASVEAEFTAGPAGLTARIALTPLAEFAYHRIGWCLLHPAATTTGADLRLRGPQGVLRTRLDESIAPQPHLDGRAVSFLPAFDDLELRRDGVALRFSFAGDLFELEDQRNWSDPSFKTYSTPLALGGGFRAEPGRAIVQSLTLQTAGSPQPAPAPGDLKVGREAGRFPAVGRGGRDPGPALRPRNGFAEFNRERPAAPHGVVIGLNGSVHAADDHSLLGGAAMHGAIVRAARRIADDAPVVLDPLDFSSIPGEWLEPDGSFAPVRRGVADDPRRAGEIGAAWVIASLAAAATSGATRLGYFDDDLDGPAARLLDDLAGLEGAPVFDVAAPRDVAALALADRVWVVNLSREPRTVLGVEIGPHRMREVPR